MEYLSSSHTPVPVKTSTLTNMTRWLEPTTASRGSYQSNINCEATKRAEYLQSQIGWRQFIRGRIAIQWGNVIKTYMNHQGIALISVERWGATLLAINWRFVLAMWTLLNKQCHCTNATDRTKSLKQKLIAEFTTILNNNQDLTETEREIINVGTGSDLSIHQWRACVHGASIIAKMNKQRQNKRRINKYKNYRKGSLSNVDKRDRSELDPG
jgi:hypothetical protein